MVVYVTAKIFPEEVESLSVAGHQVRMRYAGGALKGMSSFRMCGMREHLSACLPIA